jgi:hypothetical protein
VVILYLLAALVAVSTAQVWGENAPAEARPPLVAASTNADGTRVLYASAAGCALDANLTNSAVGTDDTGKLQAALDTVSRFGKLELVIDGPAKVTNLVVHSNTRIRCLPGAGVIQASNACVHILSNEMNTRLATHDIEIIGGLWNQDGYNQATIEHDYKRQHPCTVTYPDVWIPVFWFSGVSNLVVRDTHLLQPSNYGILTCDSINCTYENVFVDYPKVAKCSGDGLDFWGNVSDVRIINFRGNGRDDQFAFNLGIAFVLWPDPRWTQPPCTLSNLFIDGVQLVGDPVHKTHIARWSWVGRSVFRGQIVIKNLYAKNTAIGFGDGPAYAESVVLDGVTVENGIAPIFTAQNCANVTIRNVVLTNLAEAPGLPAFMLSASTTVALENLRLSWAATEGSDACLADVGLCKSVSIKDIVQRGGDGVIDNLEENPGVSKTRVQVGDIDASGIPVNYAHMTNVVGPGNESYGDR